MLFTKTFSILLIFDGLFQKNLLVLSRHLFLDAHTHPCAGQCCWSNYKESFCADWVSIFDMDSVTIIEFVWSMLVWCKHSPHCQYCPESTAQRRGCSGNVRCRSAWGCLSYFWSLIDLVKSVVVLMARVCKRAKGKAPPQPSSDISCLQTVPYNRTFGAPD